MTAAPPPSLSTVVQEGLATSWRVDQDALGLGIDRLCGLALRDNPRRAQLVVSLVLGKHVPVPPAQIRRASAALGALVAPLAGPEPLVFGYCETATALGHQVAEALSPAPWRYLHSTRRPDPTLPQLAAFDEVHSHATAHTIQPTDPHWFAPDGPLVLVDDELTTGTTVLNTIAALQHTWPRARYVVATLLDLRSASSRAAFDRAAEELGVAIDVVGLLTGELLLPENPVERADIMRQQLAALDPSPVPAGEAAVIHLDAAWPTGVPSGGWHGISADPAVDAALLRTATDVAKRLSGERVLVLGTEEFMWAPLRIAEQLPGEVLFQSTTRSPVTVADLDGYALRRTLRFPAPDEPSRISLLHNIVPPWLPPMPYDDVIVVTDGPAANADGLANLLRPWATGSVLVVSL